MDDLLYKLALHSVEGVGSVTARQLLQTFGDARSIFEARPKELEGEGGLHQKLIQQITGGEALLRAEEEMRWVERYDIQTFFIQDDNYPQRLRQISKPPTLLFYKGQASLNSLRTVGIIGTRKPSKAGLWQVEKLVEELQVYQPLILSGLAYGIDIAAHQAALQLGLPTVGVLGHGLEHLYPARHRRTAQEMIENGGLLTEYSFHTEPDPRHFPMRNRIVAALSDALIVVETAQKGGSIITANYANTYNRDVFAVPGRPGDPTAEGCNWLIKSHRAALLESATDLAYVMHWEQTGKNVQEQLKLFDELEPEEKIVVDLLRTEEALHIDRLGLESQLPHGLLAMVLLEMECKGLIRTLPGKRYVLKR
ncbi:MAG: DNA-processing protein DprA [Bacteroidota bacterium]